MSIPMTDRIKHAWNAFTSDSRRSIQNRGYSSSRPNHKNSTAFSVESYVSSIYNRIAIDVSMTKFKHVKVDPDNEDEEIMETSLQECLSVEANIDQTHIQLFHDIAYSMFDEGVVAVVPVDTTLSPEKTGAYDIDSLRVGRITQWYPHHVEVDLYNEDLGYNDRVYLEKKYVAIIENPLYAVVNGENSTLKRLLRKLQQLDDVDAKVASGRLDVMISVPYAVKTDRQRKMAEDRIRDIESQLSMGNNGIAYIDGSEKMQQLNRPVESQLPSTIESLAQEFYNQLGLTESIFDGTAREEELRAYYTRTIDPIVDNIVAELTRKFLTKTARTQGQKITYYRDMFSMVPVESIGNLGDVFRRNSIATANELRKIVGFRPSDDPRADELYNPNMPDDKQEGTSGGSGKVPVPDTLEQEEEVKERKRVLESKRREDMES